MFNHSFEPDSLYQQFDSFAIYIDCFTFDLL